MVEREGQDVEGSSEMLYLDRADGEFMSNRTVYLRGKGG